MTNVITFTPRKRYSDEGDDNAAFCCPECNTCHFHLRMDWKVECQNGHLFDWLEWDILEKDKP